ncbi:MAG TPA: c-type cytochrome, partial [Gemmatimonadaceae bacterium]|nr:c-type cytochrome [Gemmatimonadaceae bacterium]
PGAAPGSTAAPGGAAAGTTATAGGGGGGGGNITPKMIAEGDSIFHGQKAGGLCYTCHGPDAKGTQLAPPLVQHKWLTGDGSYNFIVKRVTEGVPNPTPPYTAPMPPKGGAPLTDDQVKSVAAYVYSLSHKS